MTTALAGIDVADKLESKFADAVIEVFDQGDELCAFVADALLAVFDPLNPLLGRLYRCVRRVVSEVQKEWLARLGTFTNVLDRPLREQVGGVG